MSSLVINPLLNRDRLGWGRLTARAQLVINPLLNRGKLGWGTLAAEFISVEARIHYEPRSQPLHLLFPQAYAFSNRLNQVGSNAYACG